MMVKLDLSRREREGINIIDMKGRLVAGEPCGEVRETLTTLNKTSQNKIILNMKELDYIDSTGLGTLVMCHTTLEKSGGALKLASLNKRNLELIVLTKLGTVFELYNDEQDAVNSFFPDRDIKHFDILNFVQNQQDQ